MTGARAVSLTELGRDARRFHEVISVAFAASTWAACYAVEPSKRALRPLAGTRAATRVAPALRKALEAATTRAARTVAKIPALKAANAERLTVSLAESLVFRGSIKPITFGGKLWLSYEFVKWLKRGRAEKALASVSASFARRGRGRGSDTLTVA